MKAPVFFALVALVPAAFNVMPGSGRGAMSVLFCTGDGAAHAITVPVGHSGLPGGDPPGCCAKGCHSGGTRKRALRRVDPAQ